jgi:hypothetical protein
MNYIFEDLMKIRKHREQYALNRILQARKRLREAKDEAQKRAKELSDFIRWRKYEENRLFDAIKRKYKKIIHLNQYNQCVDALVQEQDKLIEQLYQAEQQVKLAAEEDKKAYEQYILRHREKIKLEEHRKNWILKQTTIDQRHEENEVGELSTMRYNTVRS